jgi:hypothetical protein
MYDMQYHEWALKSLCELAGIDKGGFGMGGKVDRYEDGLFCFFCWHF